MDMVSARRLQIVARRAEARQRRRLEAWRRGGYNRPGNEAAGRLKDQAWELCQRLWEAEGPDPIVAQLARAQEVADRQPDPDDPDDEGGDRDAG